MVKEDVDLVNSETGYGIGCILQYYKYMTGDG
jgi:hypothetical protein